MRLQDVRRSRVAQRAAIDRAIGVLDQVLEDHPDARRSELSVIFPRLSRRRRRQLLTALYRTGSTLEQLHQVSGLPKREIRSLVGGAVDARRRHLSDDPVHWGDQLDRGYTVAQLAVAAGSSPNRLYRHLQGLGVWPRPTETFDQWLEARTRRSGSCLLWDGATTGTQTIPMAQRNGRSAAVRRLVWEHHHGAVDDVLYVTAAPDCPQPLLCVEQAHSRLLTPHEASLERAAAGRVAHGEAHGNARLTESQVLVILASPQTAPELAGRFGVSRSTVHAIKSGRRWRHLHRVAPDRTTSENI